MSPLYNFDEILDRSGERSKTWDLRTLKPGQLPMHGAETHFTCPYPVLEAVRQVSQCQVYGYPYFTDDFEKAAAGWLYRRHGWAVDPEWVEFVGGIVPGIAFVLQTVTKPGEKVLVNTPAYDPFRGVVLNNDRQLLESPLLIDCETGAVSFDWQDMEEKFRDPACTAFILCDPHNPTGKCCTREELLRIAELSEKYQVFVIVDEVHADFVFSGHRHICYPSVSDFARGRSAVVINPSKTFNVAGFRTGALILPDRELHDRVLVKVMAVKGISRTITGVAAFEACYDGRCDDYADQVRDYVEGLRDLTCDFFREHIPSITLLRPQASFVCWLDCRRLGLPQQQLLSFFAQAGTLMGNGEEYDRQLGRGFVRMAYAFPRPQLLEGLQKLKTAVDTL